LAMTAEFRDVFPLPVLTLLAARQLNVIAL
jgi:hypothetical protein